MTLTASLLDVDKSSSGAMAAPRTIEDTGLAIDQIEQLLTKTLFGGELSGHSIAERMRLPYSILEPLVERLRAERMIEVKGAAGSGTAAFRYALTDLGRERARPRAPRDPGSAGDRAVSRLRRHDRDVRASALRADRHR